MSKSDAKKEKEFELQLAEYALGTLPLDQRKALAQQLAGSAELSARLARWEEQLYPLSDAVAEVQPPQSVWENLQASLFGGEVSSRQSWWNRIEIWRSLAFASLAALVVVSILLMQAGQTPVAPSAGYIAEVDDPGSGVRVVAYYEAETGMLRLRRASGEPAGGRSFELWIIAAEAEPVSLGILPAETHSVHTIPVAVRPHFNDASILAVSDEPTGGSPTGQPTGTVLATGSITSL